MLWNCEFSSWNTWFFGYIFRANLFPWKFSIETSQLSVTSSYSKSVKKLLRTKRKVTVYIARKEFSMFKIFYISSTEPNSPMKINSSLDPAQRQIRVCLQKSFSLLFLLEQLFSDGINEHPFECMSFFIKQNPKLNILYLICPIHSGKRHEVTWFPL